ncbi:tripartite motif-containing protein 2-like [Saccostrea echinata]|uniref:tripartite motif-containing protein 2-like n=1 Tax=Saccostrea echinata TaxID=191078 RepID=UPI002A825724|nr:tripartite motif-containing protein 2-like [Saccostrea echinata]
MATPISWAQEIITCDLCDNSTQQFCNRCQVSLCGDCVSKHVDKHLSLEHHIVPFKNRKIQPVFPECEFHPNQRCEAYCHKCDVPVCIKCVITSHNGHSVRDMPNIFNDKKKEIQQETQEIETSVIPNYKKKNEERESDITLSMEKYIELEKETEKHRTIWHQEVDSIFNKLRSLIISMRDNHLAVLKSHQSKLRNMIPEILQTLQQNKEIMKSNKVSEVTNHKSKLTEYKNNLSDTDVLIPSLKSKTVQGREFSIELGECKATLTQLSLSSLKEKVSYFSTRELLDRARVIATIPTRVKPLHRVASVGTDKAWVSGLDRIIKCFDIYGSVHENVVLSQQIHPNDISVTIQGELVYSNSENRTVNIVRHGRTEILIKTPQEWTPEGLNCTNSGKILVTLYNGQQRKISCYQEQIVKQEIFSDENGKAIFANGKLMPFVAENNNGDICVSDINAKTVVVVDNTGKVRFRYNGRPARRKKGFAPRKIVTDSMSQIIVADYSNECLHILDQDGQFLNCVDRCGIPKPCGLSVDREGRLWVGLLEKGELKVIQYMR